MELCVKALDTRKTVTTANWTIDLLAKEDFCGFPIRSCITPPDAARLVPGERLLRKGYRLLAARQWSLGRSKGRLLILENLYLIPTQFRINYEIVRLTRYTSVSP